MGSLNGDVVVMRNGRSTSQVSIYNYPEHLNPFYEDEQHKRLRFWKISKKDGEGRRNSFSIGNLRDMWSFKSFSLKKKSSTLGINKTSESPPPLRREFSNVDNGWNSFDHRLRGSASSSINGDSFQRNATYRSSLQNLPSTNDRFGFNRNDDYRSTIQVPRANPRYHPQKPQVQPRRSSQSSMVSTNPFESDIDDDNEDVNSMRNVNGGSTSTLSKATPRKKRRAPAPPTPSQKSSTPPSIVINASQDDLPNDELCIREDTDIANLTAEIESFVKNTNNDDVEPITIVKNSDTKRSETASPTDGNTTKHDNEKNIIQTTTVVSTTTTFSNPQPIDHTANNITSKDEIFIVENNSTTTTTENKKQNISTTETGENPSEPVTNTTSQDNLQTNIKDKTTTTTPSIEIPITKVHSEKENYIVETKTSTAETKQIYENNLVEENVTTKQADNATKKPVNGHIPSPVDKEDKVVISNGAIPKNSKQNSAAKNMQVPVSESVQLRIEENQEKIHKPLPAQRTAKTEAEVGNVECIHVHVESPRSTPREPHPSKVTSFKNESEVITTKTPFVLTSPPRQRKATENTELTKETTKLVGSPKATIISDLRIQEETTRAKPQTMEKPAVSPKPIVEKTGQNHNFADIHKPMRNVHARRSSRDEVVTPPSVPCQQKDLPSSVTEKTIVDSASHAVEATAVEQTRLESATNTSGLKIEEPQTKDQQNETTSASSQASEGATASTRTTITSAEENMQFDSLYRPRSQMEWKRSTLAPLETNIPPEKRKSVKDIIESINRSQRLLHAAANKDFTIVTGPQTASPTVDSSNENLRILDESQREIRRMVDQMERLDRTNGTAASNGSMPSSSSPPPSYSECIAAQKLDNNEIFQKCKVKKEVYDYRESSPISSNLDWNPVPKPKRTKPQNE